jgi:tetratricopeptide (TPR) repeat protein
MKLRKLGAGLLVALLVAGLFVGCQAVADQGEKIPLTTSSQTALEYFKKGRDLQDRIRAQESRQHLEKAVAEDPNFAMAHLFLSFAAPSAKKFFESQNNAVALVDQVSEGERLWILGAKAGTDGTPAKQRELYQKLVEMYPKDERAHNLLAGHYFGQQQYENAIEHYEQAININPDFSQPYNQLGYAYRFLEKYDDAEKTFKKYIEVIPDDPNPYDSYAELLLKIGRYDESIGNYKKVLEINSGFHASRRGIATNYNLKGEHAKAREILQEHYDTASDDGQRRAALFATTVSYVDEGNLEMALANESKRFEIAKKINDAAAMAGDLGTQANILLEFGRPADAERRFQESLNTMRQSDQSAEQKELAEHGHLFNLANLNLKQGKFAQAKNYAAEYQEKAEARNNRFQIWAGHQMMGMIALEEKQFETAVAELEQCNLQNPYNIYRLAHAYEGKGDAPKAKELFTKARNFNALNSMGQAFMRRADSNMMSAK